jgi:hypothetical protein
MVGARKVTSTASATLTLTPEDSFSVTYATKSSATQTFTLPTSTGSGNEFTFVCGDAGGEILINGGASDVFNLKASEGGAAVATAAGTGCKNTAATNVKGDRITLIDIAANNYTAVGQSGIWATQ